jgi:hypothetical protein
MGIYHKLPPLPKKSVSRDQVRRAIEERFDIPSDFHFYLAIEVRPVMALSTPFSPLTPFVASLLSQSIIHIHPDFDDAVAKMFEADKLAHLFLLSTSSRSVWKSQLQARMEAAKVDSGRLHFLTDVDQKQESMLMQAADAVVASLHLTRPRASLQAFAAGVPVVTFPNELWASRITYGFYQQMGINDLIATSMEEYVALAVKLATDAPFHKKMVQLIKRNRSKLSEDEGAVKEWEKFFDFAAREMFPSGEYEPSIPPSSSEWGPSEGHKAIDRSQIDGIDEIDWDRVHAVEDWSQVDEADWILKRTEDED